MNLAEVAGKVSTACGETPQRLGDVVERAARVETALDQFKTRLGVVQGQMHAELSKLAPAATALQTEMDARRGQITSDLGLAAEVLDDTKKFVASAEGRLDQEMRVLKTGTDLLKQALDDAQNTVRQRLDAQKQRLDAALAALEAAGEGARQALGDQAKHVERLITQATEATAQEGALVGALTEALADVPRQLDVIGQRLHDESAATAKAFTTKVDETTQGIVRPRSDAAAASFESRTHDEVEAPARKTVEQLTERGVRAVGQTASTQTQQLDTEVRSKVDRSLKNLSAGPRLRELTEASKGVLRKVGKSGL